jgi:DNA-binding protein
LLKNEKNTATLHVKINDERSDGNAKEVVLKARGRAIATAVDVAEITRSRFLRDLKVSKIAIGTEEMPAREGENRARMVSTMEITLTKE